MNPAQSVGAGAMVDRGWFMDSFDGVLVVYMDGRTTQESFECYLRAICQEIDRRPDERRIGVLYDVPQPSALDSVWRKRIADALKQREDKLRRTVSSYAMCTPSIVVRGALKVMFWAAPPPYPNAIVGTLEEGCAFLASHDSKLDPVALCTEYRRRLEAVREQLGGS